MRNRTKSVLVRFSEDELCRLDEKVADTIFTREEFIRKTLDNKIIHTSPPIDFPKYITELRRVGNNISEVLKLARIRNFIDTRKLYNALEELHSTDEMLWNEFYPQESDLIPEKYFDEYIK